MTDEKPLHVRVGEAIGWTGVEYNAADWWGWNGPEPGRPWPRIPVYRYDADWGATGPLIEKYEIGLMKVASGWRADCVWPTRALGAAGSMFYAVTPDDEPPTPLVAVCNLLLALHAAGKL